MSIVYVVNEPLQHDVETGLMRRIMDLRPARKYGEIKHLLKPGTMVTDLDYVRDKIVDGLQDIQPDDYLLLIGNPAAIAIAAVVAAENTNGRLNLLRWHSRSKNYEPLSVEMWPDEAMAG